LNQNYPNFEVVAVNDRSDDGTGKILQDLKVEFPNLQVVTIDELPPEWVGKTYGLWRGYQKTGGDWILFTDADVRFHPDVLWQAITYCDEKKVDHLTAFPEIELEGLWIKPTLISFSILMALTAKPWKLRNSHSRDVLGIGAFNLIKKDSYEKIGTHKAISTELIDDIGLARLTKKSGLKLDVVLGITRIKLQWQTDLRSLIGGLEKNMFPFLKFSYVATLVGLMAPHIIIWGPMGAMAGQSPFWNVIPVLGVLSWGVIFLKIRRFQPAPLYSFFLVPFGMLIMSFALARSMWKTTVHKGVFWRDTLYPRNMFPKTTWRMVRDILMGRF